jgi:hypothetical protein
MVRKIRFSTTRPMMITLRATGWRVEHHHRPAAEIRQGREFREIHAATGNQGLWDLVRSRSDRLASVVY